MTRRFYSNILQNCRFQFQMHSQEPCRILLKESRSMHRSNSGRMQIKVKKKQEIFYIPILQTICQMLKNKTILKEVYYLCINSKNYFCVVYHSGYAWSSKQFSFYHLWLLWWKSLSLPPIIFLWSFSYRIFFILRWTEVM